MDELFNNYWPENDYRFYLQHSAEGTTWKKKNHKYITIKDGRYIYEENPTEEKIEEFNTYRKRKKNSNKVLKRMKKIDNERFLKALLNQSIMTSFGTSEGKRLANERRDKASSSLNATYAKARKNGV